MAQAAIVAKESRGVDEGYHWSRDMRRFRCDVSARMGGAMRVE